MVAPWVIPTAINATAAIGGSLLGKKKTSQVPLLTPEQKAAQHLLLNFGQTGKFGDFQAGAEVPLGYGDFNPTAVENDATSSLSSLLASGIPDQFKLGDDALRDILSGSADNIQAQFNPFKAQVERQIADSNVALKRNAAFTGNLYSSNTVKRLGDVQARGNETLMSELARLTNEALNRRERAIPLAYQSGTAQENITQNRVGAGFQYGGLTRQLNDQSIKARDAEILRRRQELQLPIQAAQTVAGQNANFGIPSVETNPFNDVLKIAGQIGGQYLGNKMFMDQFKTSFPTSTPYRGQFSAPTPASGNRLRLY